MKFNAIIEKILSIADIFYLISSFILVGIAIVLNIMAVVDVYNIVVSQDSIGVGVLNSVSLVVIAIAIFDVGKYLIEEEIYRNKELRSPHEARMTLTKFIVIIFIAISLEALVYIFLAGKQSFEDLIYPALLVLAAVVLIVGLGIYQKLSIGVEREVEAEKKKQK